MKLKLFSQLYATYILILVNLLVSSLVNIYLSIIIGIVYLIVIKEFNRTGFINRKIYYLVIIDVLFIGYITGISHFLMYLTGGIMFVTCIYYIPYRTKIKHIFYQVNLNQVSNIFSNRIVQSHQIIEFGFELRQSEIDWLTKRILFSSKVLKEAHCVYNDNELIGNSYHVNIV